jgi:hypothetical protein
LLFDLRGAGRRRTIKAVYITLALLMGGGLVFFGIGGEVSGGLVDAITERDGGGTGVERFEEQERDALARARANPEDAQAWADLARARFQQAGLGDNYDPSTGEFTEAGRAKLRLASDAWQRHLEEADEADERLARLMVQAYAPDGLNDPAQAATAQEVVAEANPRAAAVYAQLAALNYAAGRQRQGDIARDRAVRLTEPDMRESLRSQLQQARQAAEQQAFQEQAEGAAAPAEAP